MVAPSPVGSPTVFRATAAGATITLARPSGAQTGHMLVAFLRTNGSNSPSDFALSGWTRRGYTFIANDAAGRVFGIYTHPITDLAAEPASYVFTKSVATDTRRVGLMVAMKDVDLTNPVLGNSVNWDATPAPRIQLNSFAISAAVDAALVYAWAGELTSPIATAPTITPGTQLGVVGSAEPDTTSVTRTAIWAGYEPISALSTGNKSLTYSGSPSGAAASGVVLRGAASTPTVKPGFTSVAEMLATDGATWAHRGGSASWPEMSEYAYDQAVAAGYGALEFSANRTSDGVWVGVHDASLNRTSQTTGLPDISTMTWAQVQTYQNSLNSAGTPRPYYRLDTFLDKYTPTHVVIVDPKYAIGTYNTEFLNLLDAHGGNSKIVVKFYGAGSGAVSLADAAAARGYQTWGYFYDTDVTSGDLAAWQSHWSILGMNYDAVQSAWYAVLAYGKPVVGHIAGSQANYDTARQKGARIVQTAAVASVRPISSWSRTLAITPLTASGSGSRTVPGSSGPGVLALPALQGTASGTASAPAFAGAAALGLMSLIAAGAGGSAVPVYAGQGATVLPPLQAVGAGAGVAPIVVGTGSLLLSELLGAGAGDVSVPPHASGAGVLTLPVLTAAAAGTSTVPSAAGTAQLLVGALAAVGAGTVSGDPNPVVVPAHRTLTADPLVHSLTSMSIVRTLEDA